MEVTTMYANVHRSRPSRPLASIAGLATVLVVAALAGPADAHERGRGHDRHRDHARRHAAHGHHPGGGHGHHDVVDRAYGVYRFDPLPVPRAPRHAPARFVVPVRIARPLDYAPYRYGRMYHAGHRHWHEVYRFPVYGAVGVTWRPYDYCGGHVHATGVFAYDGPRFSVRVGF